jgi:hypothetical protein
MTEFEAKEWGDKTHVRHSGVECEVASIPPTVAVLNIDFKTFNQRIKLFKEGMPAQFAFPTLTNDEREFLISGCPLGHEISEYIKDEDKW